MAQNITLLGASYSDVPAVNLPKTGGGTASFTDVSDTTATASDVSSSKYFYTAAGVKTQGSAAAKTSANLTVSGATVTAPAGLYASNASASVPSGSATTPATTITANPSISVSSSGLITASASATKSVTPTVSAGYVSSGTAGTITVSGSNTSQLTTQAAQTIYPSTSDQTITSGKYLTGTQTIKGVLLTNLDAGNIKKDVVVKVGDSADDDRIISVTGTYEGGGGGGIPANLSAFILFETSSPQGPSASTNRTAYFFETGMTWAQFVASSYNTGGFFIEDMTGMNLVCITPSKIGGTVDIVRGYRTSPDSITGSDTIAVGTYTLDNFY